MKQGFIAGRVKLSVLFVRQATIVHQDRIHALYVQQVKTVVIKLLLIQIYQTVLKEHTVNRGMANAIIVRMVTTVNLELKIVLYVLLEKTAVGMIQLIASQVLTVKQGRLFV